VSFGHDIESKHLAKRIKERTGLPKRSHAHFLRKVREKGLTIESLKKIPTLYNYVKSISRDGYTLIVYNLYVVVISNTGIGITILNIPKEYHELLKKDKKVHLDVSATNSSRSKSI